MSRSLLRICHRKLFHGLPSDQFSTDWPEDVVMSVVRLLGSYREILSFVFSESTNGFETH